MYKDRNSQETLLLYHIFSFPLLSYSLLNKYYAKNDSILKHTLFNLRNNNLDDKKGTS